MTDQNEYKRINDLVCKTGFGGVGSDFPAIDLDKLAGELDALCGPEFKPMDLVSLKDQVATVATTESEPDGPRAATVATENHKTSIAEEDFPDEETQIS